MWTWIEHSFGMQILSKTHFDPSINLVMTLRFQIDTYLAFPVWISLSGTQ